MIPFILVFSIFHVVGFLILTYLWQRIMTNAKVYPPTSIHPGISVIVPMRNEEGQIPRLIRSLQQQDCDPTGFELILVDDHSTDDTIRAAERVVMQSPFAIRILQLPASKSGKKAALSLGVNQAKYDWILCTDADCEPVPTWLSTMRAHMSGDHSVMLTGPVEIRSNGFFATLQSLEFGGLIGYGAITLFHHQPTMCNGANMAYKKAVFLEVDGYKGNEHIPTGDDEFLLQKVHHKYPGRISFVPNKKAIVKTVAKPSLAQLISQRVRWTSKWKNHHNKYIHLSAILAFFDFLSSALIFPLAFMGYPWLILVWFCRFLSEFLYIRVTAAFFNNSVAMPSLAFLSIIYPFYAVLLGIASIFGKYSWKERTY